MTTSCYILEDGVLYRGFSRSFPVERWSRRQRRFLPYRGKTPKPIEWGDLIDEAEARAFMDDAPAEAPAAPIESGDEPSFWTVAAKFPFVMRMSSAGAEFYNRRTGRWHRWPGEFPPCARMVTKADAWRWLRHQALALDFGTIDPPYRDWPAPAST